MLVAQAAGEFRRLLINLYLSGEMSAQRVIRIAYLATKSGASGCEQFGKDIKHNKNCARLLHHVLRYDEVRAECLHTTTMPLGRGGRRKRQAVLKEVSTIPVFEVFARQFSKEPETFLEHRKDPDLLCDNFHSHDLVSKYGAGQGIPCRIFADFAVLDGQATQLNIQRLRRTPPLSLQALVVMVPTLLD